MCPPHALRPITGRGYLAPQHPQPVSPGADEALFRRLLVSLCETSETTLYHYLQHPFAQRHSLEDKLAGPNRARRELTMKLMSMVACGIAISSIAMSALGRSPPDNYSLHADRQTGLQAWSRQPVRTSEVAQPAPLGDLRGDIASNVRAQPAPNRQESPHHH
jgi:hypothetical protein